MSSIRHRVGSWDRSIRVPGDSIDTYGFIHPEQVPDEQQMRDVFAHLDHGRFAVRYRGEYYPLGNQLFDGRAWREVTLPRKHADVVFRLDSSRTHIAQTKGPPTLYWVAMADARDLESDTLETDSMILRARVQYGLPPGTSVTWTPPTQYWSGSVRDIARLSELTQLHFRRQPSFGSVQPKVRILFERRDGKNWRPTEDPRLHGRFTFATQPPSLR